MVGPWCTTRTWAGPPRLPASPGSSATPRSRTGCRCCTCATTRGACGPPIWCWAARRRTWPTGPASSGYEPAPGRATRIERSPTPTRPRRRCGPGTADWPPRPASSWPSSSPRRGGTPASSYIATVGRGRYRSASPRPTTMGRLHVPPTRLPARRCRAAGHRAGDPRRGRRRRRVHEFELAVHLAQAREVDHQAGERLLPHRRQPDLQRVRPRPADPRQPAPLRRTGRGRPGGRGLPHRHHRPVRAAANDAAVHRGPLRLAQESQEVLEASPVVLIAPCLSPPARSPLGAETALNRVVLPLLLEPGRGIDRA